MDRKCLASPNQYGRESASFKVDRARYERGACSVVMTPVSKPAYAAELGGLYDDPVLNNTMSICTGVWAARRLCSLLFGK